VILSKGEIIMLQTGVWVIESIEYSMGESTSYIRQGLIFETYDDTIAYLKKWKHIHGAPKFIGFTKVGD
jgi:hypothetical protein